MERHICFFLLTCDALCDLRTAHLKATPRYVLCNLQEGVYLCFSGVSYAALILVPLPG